MKKIEYIIETYDEFINELSTGGAAYPTAISQSSTSGVNTQELELFLQAGKTAMIIPLFHGQP